MSDKTIKVCSEHQDEEVVPLIWTFAFPGAEYWCPGCGWSMGMLGAGENVEWTQELQDRLDEYKKATRQYLRGNGLLVCSKTKYKGKWIDPSELPLKSRQFWQKKAQSWKCKYQ